jgi:uncharacterized protein (TIGR02145 family)
MALAAARICTAQSVEIKGVVKDASGAGIAGVVLKLEKTAFQAVSGADGSFTLNNQSSGVAAREGIPPRLTVAVDPASLRITVPAKGDVSVTAFGMDGKELSNLKVGMEAGTHSIPLPHRGQGLVFYRVEAGGHSVMTRSLSLSADGGAEDGRIAAFSVPAGTSLRKAAAPAASFKDILSASKTGFLPYRLTMTTQTASGLEVRMLVSAGSIKDADGNEYQTVKLGNQTWMAEHLRTTKYNDGTAIPQVQDKAAWANRATPAFCYYNGMANPDSIKRFGALYNWHTINTKKLAPEGWHVPSGAEWTTLQNYLIGNGFNFDGTNSGNKVGKSMASMTDWVAATKAGAVGNDQSKNNKSGFGAVPTGFRDQGGNFTSMGSRSIMHATDTKENTFGYFADVDASSETLRYSDDWMSMGFLVRLVKN